MDSTPLRVALLRPRAAKRLGRGATPTYMVSRDDFNVRGAGKLRVVRGHGVCDSIRPHYCEVHLGFVLLPM